MPPRPPKARRARSWPKPSGVATPKKAASRALGRWRRRTGRGLTGVTAAERPPQRLQLGVVDRARRRPSSRRARAARARPRAACGRIRHAKNSPVEMSSQASAKSASASLARLPRATAISQLLRRASSSVSSVSVPGVTSRMTSRRTTDLEPRLLRLGRILDLLADGDPVAERDQPLQIVVGALRPARRTSGCRAP